MRNATRLLSRCLLPAMSILAMAGTICLAQSPKVEAVDYQDGALSIRASDALEAPQTEAWPGNIGQNATELVIISFPHAAGDLPVLQQMSTQLLLKHPELKRFLVSPLNPEKATNKKDSTGFQLVVEMAIPPGTDVVTPTPAQLQPNLWVIGLRKNAQIPVANAIPPISNAVDPSTGASSQTEQWRTIQELQAQIAHLTDELKASTAKQQVLQDQLARYTDFIRPYQPEFARGKEDSATIQNLRLALIKVAEKLKATEAALAEQAGQNKALTRQLAAFRSYAPEPTTLPQGLDEASRLKPQSKSVAIQPSVPAPASVAGQEKTLQASLIANPRQWKTYLDLARLQAAHGDTRSAESVLARLLKANPGYAPGYYQLAHLYVQDKRMLEAQVAMNTYQRLQPNDTQGIHALKKAMKPPAKATVLAGTR